MFVVVFQQVCTDLGRIGWISVHPSLQILSKSLRFWGCRLATWSSLHRFSMGFRSGEWLGHSRTLICFFLSHSFVALAVCLGSLSCWKTHPRPIFSTLTEGRRLSPKISQYMAPFFLCSIRWSRPVPLAEKHPQSIRFPPPCFTVGMVFLGLYSSFLFLQTRRVELMLYFCLIWPHHLLPSLLRIIQVFFGKLLRGLYMCVFQQRNLAHAARF